MAKQPKTRGLKSGEVAEVPGIYEQRGPRGGHGPEVTRPGNHKVPPGPKGATFNLKVRTHTKSGGGN